MLGDYLNYNTRPVDWSAQPSKTESNKAGSQHNADTKTIPAYAAAQEQEDGYDPYNHPIDRRIIEKHRKKAR